MPLDADSIWTLTVIPLKAIRFRSEGGEHIYSHIHNYLYLESYIP
jgi:hypothetical protein